MSEIEWTKAAGNGTLYPTIYKRIQSGLLRDFAFV